MFDNFITVEKAAATLGVHRMTILRALEKGTFPNAVKSGRNYLIDPKELRNYYRPLKANPHNAKHSIR